MRATRNRRWRMLAVLTCGSLLFAVLTGPTAPADARSSPASASRSSTLCRAVAHLDRLVVRRTDELPQDHFHFAFAAVVVVSHVAEVRQAASAVCGLPKMPHGVFHCPADFGIDYHLTFAANGRIFPTVTLDATGCEQVNGLGPTRWIARTPGFWHTLGTAMGMARPTENTFRGSREKS